MYKVKCLNPIAKVGMDVFSDAYEKTEEFAEAEVAMRMAMAMMDSADISMSDIQSSSMYDEFGELGHSWLNGGEAKQYFVWKKILIQNLAYFFDCSVVNCTEGRKSKFDTFFAKIVFV